MAPPLSEQVIVITGASSGIGRATAIDAARAGATVVLLARNEQALNEACAEATEGGGSAHPIVTDVGDREAVERAAQEVLTRFGRVDTWINNAGVYAVAPVERMTSEEMEQVIRVNVLGVIYGSKAVLPHFIERGTGVLINVASVVGTRATPLLAAYSASKHAVKGFTESLRLEMEHDHPGIAVCMILPASINTPIFRHALSRIGVHPRPFPPVWSPENVADAILDCAVSPKRDVFVGMGRGMAAMEGMAPGLLDHVMLTGGGAYRAQESDMPEDTRHNLFGPMPAETYGVYGEWMDEMRETSLGTKLVELHPTRAKLLTAAASAAAIVAFARRSR
jgi:NAD(P)-dependent dehydrogenase (short-subunit alcohol dehydrogenase family)